jgi:O-antigen ligase
MKIYKKLLRVSHIQIISWLLYSLPFSLIFSRFFADFSIVIISIIFLFFSIRDKKYKYYSNYFFYYFLLFYFYIVITSVFAYEILSSFFTSITYIRFILFSLAIWYVLDNNKKFSINFLKFLAISFFALSIDSIIQFLFGENILGWKKILEFRISSFFGKELVMGSYIVRLFPLLFGLYFFHRENFKNHKINFIIIILIFNTVLLSGERTSFFLLLLFFVTYFLILNTYIFNHRKVIFFSFLTIFFVAIFLVFSPIYKHRFITSTQGLVFGETKFTFFTYQHESHYRSALNMFVDKPIIGVGVKQFRYLCDLDKYKINTLSCATHPHNIFIQFLAELGTVGILFYLFVFYLILREIFKLIFLKRNNFYNKNKILFFNISIILCFFINLFPLVPSGNFFNNWLSIIFYIPLGFYLKLHFEKKLLRSNQINVANSID